MRAPLATCTHKHKHKFASTHKHAHTSTHIHAHAHARGRADALSFTQAGPAKHADHSLDRHPLLPPAPARGVGGGGGVGGGLGRARRGDAARDGDDSAERDGAALDVSAGPSDGPPSSYARPTVLPPPLPVWGCWIDGSAAACVTVLYFIGCCSRRRVWIGIVRRVGLGSHAHVFQTRIARPRFPDSDRTSPRLCVLTIICPDHTVVKPGQVLRDSPERLGRMGISPPLQQLQQMQQMQKIKQLQQFQKSQKLQQLQQ